MKLNLNIATLVLGVLVFTGAAPAAEPDVGANPYRAIAKHNTFGLVPPPLPANLNAATLPPDITLNGIMVVFGRKYALFKLPASKGGNNYLLAEGQSDGEIKLLSVDDRSGTMTINNHGAVQTVVLCKPPALSSAPPVAAAAGVVPAMAAGNGAQPASAEAVRSPATEDNQDFAARVVPAGYAVVGAGNASGNNPPSAGASGSQNSGGSSSTPKPEPWWVIGSRNVEASRVATAALVESGQADPYPLTPFTPPGTPAALIGAGQLYFVQPSGR